LRCHFSLRDVAVCQELLTAATGLNTSLIEDVKVHRRLGQVARPQDLSDRKALSEPTFAVIQALVALLAQAGPCFAALNRTSVSSPARKCKISDFVLSVLFRLLALRCGAACHRRLRRRRL